MTLERPNLPDLAADGIGVVIFCPEQMCRRASQYIPIDKALARFGPVSLRTASRRLRCGGCGGPASLAISTLDVGEKGKGRPPGELERRQAERSIADAAAEFERCIANGWPTDRLHVPPTPWW